MQDNVSSQSCIATEPVIEWQPSIVDTSVPAFDLANAKVKEVFVGCWLDMKRSRWGQHKEQETGILHLTIEADHPPEFRVSQFQVELAFSKSQTKQLHDQKANAEQSEERNDRQIESVFLYGRPAPSCVNDDQNVAWKFSGHRIAPQGGLATTARWVWAALNPGSSTSECGDLFCGVIVQHLGTTHPIQIQYHIEGRAREADDEGYQRPYKFSSETQHVQPWLIQPLATNEELSDEDMEKLNEEILGRYASCRMSMCNFVSLFES